MRKTLLLVFTTLAITSYAQEANEDGLTFVSLQRDFVGTTLGYRKANIDSNTTDSKSLVIYLHGGSSCGTDNTTQMKEPGIDSIANYLVSHQKSAVFVVPQCPDRNKGWGGMAKNVKALLDFTAQTENVDINMIYIFGGSMGGTGTWKMLSTYPNFFAAGMPCAANPKGMSAENVATTPVYNVMGLDDKIMNGEVRAIAEDFISQLQQLGDETKYETVEGWTHETTCIQSYSTERLDWVFAHKKQSANGIETTVNDIYGNNAWYTLQGIKITQPLSHGLYIHNGKKVMVK